MIGTKLSASVIFTWLQGAGFYRDVHQKAVDCLPHGEGKNWLDVGCGPGLVARQAAARGYEVMGADTDSHMVRTAKRLARWHGSTAVFQKGDLQSLVGQQADVVSAASLLAVLDDKSAGLEALWGFVRPGGYLLIIEPTAKMNPINAKRLISEGNLPCKRRSGLKMWAAAREGRAVDVNAIAPTDMAKTAYIECLEGLVGIWVFNKAA
ncbi:MAG: class I SAM-dependent methyltransferase [Ectothiorhodospiraceae bacterium]|nr:class I SAM-dependent methyltransferase [Ectothiorhodospiraceae bacterium]